MSAAPPDSAERDVGEHERQGAEEQALCHSVGEDDARVVHLAAERGHEDQHETDEATTDDQRGREVRVVAHQEVGNDRRHREHAERDTRLGDDVVDGHRTVVGARPVGLGLRVLRLTELLRDLRCAGRRRSERGVSAAALLFGQVAEHRVTGGAHRAHPFSWLAGWIRVSCTLNVPHPPQVPVRRFRVGQFGLYRCRGDTRQTRPVGVAVRPPTG